MRSLIVGNISGIFNQLLDWHETVSGDTSYLKDNYLDINSCFWSEQFARDIMQRNLDILFDRIQEMPVKVQWALKHQEKFLDKIDYAKEQLSTVCTEPKNLYKYLEVLQLACEIISHANMLPYSLNIASGFMRNSDSAKELKENCTNPFANPYLTFLKEKVLPLITNYNPEILWLTGAPNVVSFATGKLVRSVSPNTYLGVAFHSSEYYSLNKIVPLLRENHHFFSVFDLLVLDDNRNTMTTIEKALANKKSLKQVPNIMYTTDFGKTIIVNKRCISNQSNPTVKVQTGERPAEIKLFPCNHCYWNKCTFCGINQKYLSSQKEWAISGIDIFLQRIQSDGVRRFWLLDEAIPPKVLLEFAQMIIKKNLAFEWHARTRIEFEMLEADFCEILKASGLKSILLGFESASERILTLMNKTAFPETYVETAENIVKKFNDNDISVHFPAIIGFPTETDTERRRTLSFLQYLRKKYPLFSYNINIFELDVSSIVYKKFAEYDICSVTYPCEPYTFMGNVIEWNVYDRPKLEKSQRDAMKYLFEWYPKHSLIAIDVFYRLLEHTRLPFWSKELYFEKQDKSLNTETDYIKIKETISLHYNDNDNAELVLFDEEYLDYVLGGMFLETLYALKEWYPVKELLNDFSYEFQEAVKNSIQELISINFLELRR